MRKIVAYIIQRYLLVWVRVLKRRHKPQIIGITGSIGKTSTKEAITMVLREEFSVLAPGKSYNTPMGLMLGILGMESGFSSVGQWIKILLNAPVRAFKIKTAQIWVLEMGADHPGDIEELTKMIHPNIGILLNINPVHLAKEQFKDLDDIRREKEKIFTCLNAKETAILNADDVEIKKSKGRTHAKTIWYSATRAKDVYASNVKSTKGGIEGIFHFKDEKAPFSIPILGTYHIEVFLPAIVCAVLFGISLERAAQALKEFKPPPGRMSLIPGIHKSTIIDSSYNSSPTATAAALKILAEMPAANDGGIDGADSRKIAVLGSMNELGNHAEAEHRKLGAKAATAADMLLCVGEQAKWIAVEAVDRGMEPKQVFTFEDAEKAGEFLQENLVGGDIVLFKGSQNKVRLERAVKMIMKEPEKAKTLLARSEAEWENIS